MVRWMDEWVSEGGGWASSCLRAWMNERMKEGRNELKKEWMKDGWMNVLVLKYMWQSYRELLLTVMQYNIRFHSVSMKKVTLSRVADPVVKKIFSDDHEVKHVVILQRNQHYSLSYFMCKPNILTTKFHEASIIGRSIGHWNILWRCDVPLLTLCVKYLGTSMHNGASMFSRPTHVRHRINYWRT